MASSAACQGIGIVLLPWAQIVTHNRTHARERAARHDALMIRRFEVEQETLLELQDAVTQLHDIVERKYVETNHKDLNHDSEFWKTYYKIMKLTNRSLSREVERNVQKYAEFAARITLQVDPRENDIPNPELPDE